MSEGKVGTRRIKVTMYMEVSDYALDTIKGTITHHIDYLIDQHEWPEIKNIYNCKVEDLRDEDKEADNNNGCTCKYPGWFSRIFGKKEV